MARCLNKQQKLPKQISASFHEIDFNSLLFFSAVPFPPANKMTIADVFDSRTNKPKPDVLKQHFILEGRLDENAALKIINEGAALLRSEKTMIDIEAPVTGKKHCLFFSAFRMESQGVAKIGKLIFGLY